MGIKVSREDLLHIMDIINDRTQQSGSVLATHIGEISKKVAHVNNYAAPNNTNDNMQINNNEVNVIIDNNPHDTMYKASVDELMSIVEGNTIYVCSSLDDFKGDVRIIRDADLTEAQRTIFKEV